MNFIIWRTCTDRVLNLILLGQTWGAAMSNEGEELEQIAFDVPSHMARRVQQERKAGARCNGKILSKRAIFELGYNCYFGVNGDETRDMILKKIEDSKLKESISHNETLLWEKKLEECDDKNKIKEEEALKSKQEVESLASKIKECWENITVFKKKEYVGFIVNSFPGRFTRENVSAVFPDGSVSIPTNEEALQIATDLLRSGCDE